MTMEPTPAGKTPWLAIALGGLAVLCLCAIVVCAAIVAFFVPIRSSTLFLETPSVVIPENGPAHGASIRGFPFQHFSPGIGFSHIQNREFHH